MPDVTLIVDGKIIKDDSELVGRLVGKLTDAQSQVNLRMTHITELLKEMGQTMADVSTELLNAIGTVKASVDTLVADVTALLSQSPPNIQGALDALAALQNEVDAADASVKAALPPGP